jgi:hypothetical protein
MNRRFVISSIVLVFTLWTLPVSAQVIEQTFSEDIANFKISTPNPLWKFAPRSISPGIVRANLRFETPVEHFVPNATVQVTPLPDEKTTLEALVEKDLASLADSVEVEKKSTVEHRGITGYEIWLYDKKTDLKFQQWVFLAKGKTFVITCAAKKSSFPRFEEDFKMILNSFEIL